MSNISTFTFQTVQLLGIQSSEKNYSFQVQMITNFKKTGPKEM